MPLISSILIGVAVLLVILSASGVWDRFGAWYLEKLSPQLQALRIGQAHIPTYMRWWGVVLLAALALAIVAPPLAIAALYLAYIAPGLFVTALIERRRRLLRDQLVSATVAMANACRAGLS